MDANFFFDIFCLHIPKVFAELKYWLGKFVKMEFKIIFCIRETASGLKNKQERKCIHAKGQLILKCLFGVFNFLQETNKNKSHSNKIEFVCSFFGNISLKNSFRFCLTFN